MVFHIGFVLTFLLAEGHYQFVAAPTAPAKGASEALVVPSQIWDQDSLLFTVAKGVWHPSSSSFPRPFFPAADCSGDGAVRGGLEMPCMLAHEQGQDGEVRTMRHQVDARARCDVRPTEATQESEENFLELRRQTCQLRLAGLGSFAMARSTSRRQHRMEQAKKQDAQKARFESQEGQSRDLWSPGVGAPVADQLYRWTIGKRRGRRAFGDAGEADDSCDGFAGVEHDDDTERQGHRERALHADPHHQGIEGSGGQDGQSKEETQGSRESEVQHALFMAPLHRRLLAALDSVCREVWQGRPRAGGARQGSQGETSEDKGR